MLLFANAFALGVACAPLNRRQRMFVTITMDVITNASKAFLPGLSIALFVS